MKREQANRSIRDTASEYGVYLYEVAMLEGVSYDTFMRRMRKEFSNKEQSRICQVIKEYARKNKEETDDAIIPDFEVGEYIIYRNGETYELGRVKSVCKDGCFVAYNNGETGAKTHFEDMHKLMNAYTINSTNLGGAFFEDKKNV